MALLESGGLTLAEVVKRRDPNGRAAMIAEVLTKKMPLLEDIPWIEGNNGTGHVVTERAALPAVTIRNFNEGLAPTYSQVVPYSESSSMFTTHSRLDVDLAETYGNPQEKRATEDVAHAEAIMQEVEKSLWYGNSLLGPKYFDGFSSRYNGQTKTSSYVIATMEGSLSAPNVHSVWLINWGPDRVSGFYPQGSAGGLVVEDLGKQLVQDPDSATKEYVAWVTRQKFRCGLAVHDYRNVVRGKLDLDEVAVGEKGLYLGMQDMMSMIYDLAGGTPRFYMNREVYKRLLNQLGGASANFLEYVAAGGKRIPSFLGIPIRVTDLLVAEASA